jgi:hypothetical protein
MSAGSPATWCQVLRRPSRPAKVPSDTLAARFSWCRDPRADCGCFRDEVVGTVSQCPREHCGDQLARQGGRSEVRVRRSLWLAQLQDDLVFRAVLVERDEAQGTCDSPGQTASVLEADDRARECCRRHGGVRVSRPSRERCPDSRSIGCWARARPGVSATAKRRAWGRETKVTREQHANITRTPSALRSNPRPAPRIVVTNSQEAWRHPAPGGSR